MAVPRKGRGDTWALAPGAAIRGHEIGNFFYFKTVEIEQITVAIKIRIKFLLRVAEYFDQGSLHDIPRSK